MDGQVDIDGNTESAPPAPIELWEHDIVKRMADMDPEHLLEFYDAAVIMAQSVMDHRTVKHDRDLMRRRLQLVKHEIIARMCRAFDSKWDFIPPTEK